MQGLTLKADDKRLSIKDVEEHLQVVELYFLRVVVDRHVHLLAWFEGSSAWLDVEDPLLEYVALKRLFLGWLARISPWL